MTAEIPAIAGRPVPVACAPGAGLGHPACYLPAIPVIEVDGDLLGVSPATASPASPADRERYPVVWGALTHEGGHAAHSKVCPPPAEKANWCQAAHLLEESRMEAAQVTRRPGDRRWLRATVSKLILGDFTAAGAAPGTPREAGSAAALVLARRDAGILEPAETADVAAKVDEGDRRRCPQAPRRHLEGRPPGRRRRRPHHGPPGPPLVPHPRPRPRRRPARPHRDRPLGPAGCHPRRHRRDQRRRRGGLHPAAALPARPRKPNATPRTPPASTPTAPPARSSPAAPRRRPSPAPASPAIAEKAAARRLTRTLRDATAGTRDTVTVTSPVPPGRLRMRQVLAADAQRAAGARPTAEPFTRTRSRRVPAPPLRAGIACDISGSMRAFTGPVASAAWILARAACALPAATTATVLYGEQVHALTHPGHAPARVTDFAAPDGTEQLCRAIDALDGALGLSRPGTARLLAIVSDTYHTPEEIAGGQRRITRLAKTGCGVIILRPDDPFPWDETHEWTDAQVITLTDPADTIEVIARAATRALTA